MAALALIRPTTLAALATLAALGPARAGLPQFCATPAPPEAALLDRALQVAAVLRDELRAGGYRAALVSRSGVDLRRFEMRYSHAGVALRDTAAGPWAVRQLYFACDERAPRLYDEGLAAFVLGSAAPSGNVHANANVNAAAHVNAHTAVGFVSLVALPEAAAQPLAAAARDDARALSLLGARYSANAHAFSTRYQNCNQWLAELLALAWQPPPEGADEDARAAAQRWLQHNGYEPAVFAIGWRPMLWLAALNPFLHQDDHPAADLAAARLRVSMPRSVEAFAMARHPEARRLELCHTRTHLVLRRDGAPLPDDCTPAPGDTVVTLD